MINKGVINKFLRRWNVEMHGVNYLRALRRGEFREDEFDYFRKKIKSINPVIIDAGANRGLMIEKFLNCFKNPMIYAFEPIPELNQFLKNHYSGLHAVNVFDFALSDVETSTEFYINKGMDTSSLLLPQKTGLNSDGSVQVAEKIFVETKKLDTLKDELKIQKVDILKMDIQGNELKALKGAEGLLKSSDVDVIYLETYFIQQYKEQPLFYDIASYLRTFGFELQDLYNPIYGNGRIAWCDAVFIK